MNSEDLGPVVTVYCAVLPAKNVIIVISTSVKSLYPSIERPAPAIGEAASVCPQPKEVIA